MAVSVIQSANGATHTATGTFTTPPTVGNTVFLTVTAYSGSDTAIATSSPTLNGGVVPGVVKLQEVLSAFDSSLGQKVLHAVWMLPNVPVGDGSGNFGITISNGSINSIQAIEVAGLGQVPAWLDQSISGASSASGSSTVDSGATPATQYAGEFVLGVAAIYAGASAGPSIGGWTTIMSADNSGWSGYQISSSAGGTYDWAQTASGTGAWTAGVVTITPANYVRITCTGTSFTPMTELRTGSTAALSWTVEGGSTVTGLTPTITLPGGTSYVDLSASDSGSDAMAQLATFNIGYDDSVDNGRYNIGTSYNWTAQSVSAVQNITLMTGLTIFAADYTALAGALDFSNMSALTNIEVYQTQVTGVTLTGCTSLRRLQVEQCHMTTLDLNPISGNLYDLRAAAQAGGSLTFTTLTNPMAKEYHFCVRDQVLINPPTATQLPVVEEQWIWNDNLSEAFIATSTVLTSLLAEDNYFTSADLTSLPSGAGVRLDKNNLSSITLGNPLSSLDASYNNLDTEQMDAILATADGWGTTGGVLNLAGNRPPSPTGQAHVTSLQGKSWTVTVETLTSAARSAGVIADDFHRADATGISAVGNGWFTPGSANANISSNMLVRTDSGSYQQFLNSGGGLLPADYTVYARFPGSDMVSHPYFGLIGRYTSALSEGVQAFFNGGWGAADLNICNSRGYMTRVISYTTLASFPTSWSNTSIDHTMALQMSGETITVILDGVAVARGTMPNNATLSGTCYGICGEGDNRTWYSIGTTTPEGGSLSTTLL